MSSSAFDSSSTSFDLASIYQTAQDTRVQLAQYAIAQAASYMSNNKNDQAIQSFKKALALDPQNATAYNYMGNIYLAQGKNSDAIKAFQQVVRIQSNAATASDSSSAPTMREAHVSLGNAYLQDKQYVQSEKEFKIASRLNPQDPVADYTLGQQYLTQGRLDEAEAQFIKVQKIAPRDGNVYYALGQLYNKKGDFEEAAKNLEKSLTLKKNFPAANYELGIAYDGLGRTDDAQGQLSILKGSDSSLAAQLNFVLSKPGMVTMDTKKTDSSNGNFIELLGPGTPLWYLDPSLLTPNSSKSFTVTFKFNNDMDMASVTNAQNWTISRANSTEAGYYNNTMPVSSKEASIMTNPEAITYNSLTQEATIKFRISQNANGDATIDPSHIVFKFSGTDAAGREMDQTANEIDGYRLTPF